MLLLRFQEEKTTQIACFLLKIVGGKMDLLKLNKLLYLVDRDALRRWGRPLSHDYYVSMPHGPVLSRTYNLMNGEIPSEYWAKHISKRTQNEISLVVENPPEDRLSEADKSLIREIYRQHGNKTGWELREFSHTLPEWQDPAGSSIPIDYCDILRAVGRNEDDIEAIEEELCAVDFAQSLLE